LRTGAHLDASSDFSAFISEQLTRSEQLYRCLSFARSSPIEDFCGEGGSVADNFLQKQQN